MEYVIKMMVRFSLSF